MTTRDPASDTACLPLAQADADTDQNRGYRWTDAEATRIDITGLPAGYINDDERMMILRIKSNGTEPVCGPLRVAMKLKNPDETASAHVIEFYTTEGRRRHTVITATNLMTAPTAVAAHLAELGLTITGTASQLAHLLRQWVADRQGCLAEQPGWFTADQQLAYVTQHGTIYAANRNADALPIIAIGGETVPDQAGSARAWYEGPARLAQGNPLVMFAIASALAGPLFEPLGLEGGGAALFGGTSCGKSTALAAGVSVHGSPKRTMTFNASAAAFETAAYRAKDALLAIDEIPTRLGSIARELSGVLYMLSNGVGRKRSNRELADLDPAVWKTMILTTAEASLPEIYALSRMVIPEGLATRFADIPAESWRYRGFANLHEYDQPAAFADGLKRECHATYGHAAPHFLQQLTKALAKDGGMVLRRAYASLLKDLLAPIDTVRAGPESGPEQRVMRRFAVVALAGQLACHWGIVPWSKGETQAAIREIAGLWLKQRRQRMPAAQEEVPEQIKVYLDANPASFADVAAGKEFRVGTHSGWHDAGKVAISSEAFSAIVHPMLPRDAARQLDMLGILIVGGEARSLQQRRSPRIDPSRGREYWVSKAALERYLGASIW